MDIPFEKIKREFISPPVLSSPKFEQRFIVETDASLVGVGASLYPEKEDGHVQLIEFAS